MCNAKAEHSLFAVPVHESGEGGVWVLAHRAVDLRHDLPQVHLATLRRQVARDLGNHARLLENVRRIMIEYPNLEIKTIKSFIRFET